MLEPGHWEAQYSLSLELYETSSSVSLVFGDTSKISNYLDSILTHSKSFEDSLNASMMLVRLLFSLSKYNEAKSNCLGILEKLGETFPQEPNLAVVLTQLSRIQPLLLGLTVDQIKSLPSMTDTTKLQAMKFLSMLCSISGMGTPLLLPILSIRMIELTIQFGFCNDSIFGLFYTAFSQVSVFSSKTYQATLYLDSLRLTIFIPRLQTKQSLFYR